MCTLAQTNGGRLGEGLGALDGVPGWWWWCWSRLVTQCYLVVVVVVAVLD